MGAGCGPNLDPQLSESRSFLAATTVTCPNGNQQALFGGGLGVAQSDGAVVDIFDGGDSLERSIGSLSVGRSALSATSVQCNDKGYALFGGGFDGTSQVNDVDVFECNDAGLFFKERLELSVGRSALAATSVTAPDGKQYALFGGGGTDTESLNTVDIFHCNDNGVFFTKSTNFNRGPSQANLAATTVNCGGVDYALFGGGFIGIFINDIDIFDSSSLEFI
jgi:hypothetical protein